MLDGVKPIVPDGLLKDKVIIITGASQGIGRSAAFGFARAGAKIVICARRGPIVEELAREIESKGGKAIGLKADVTSEADVKTLINAAVSTYGRLDGLFNNAGIELKFLPFCDVTYEDWKRVHDVKIHGTFLCMKYAIPAMIKGGGGAIVNNGSTVARRTVPGVSFGASSQAAIIGLTRAAATEYAKSNIRVNMLATGGIITQERLAAESTADKNSYADESVFHKPVPMARLGRPDEDAQAAAWLLSDYASYITGAELAVDGGLLAACIL